MLDQLALWITNKVGSMGFFVLIFVWTVAWLGWNIFAPAELRFDPYPAFVLWLFISNMIQLFLLPLIMIGQNLQSQHSEHRAETDLMINELAEMENETILIHLENQNAMMMDILKKMESGGKTSAKLASDRNWIRVWHSLRVLHFGNSDKTLPPCSTFTTKPLSNGIRI